MTDQEKIEVLESSLGMIRETVETLGPVGAVSINCPYPHTPEPHQVVEAIIEGVKKIVDERVAKVNAAVVRCVRPEIPGEERQFGLEDALEACENERLSDDPICEEDAAYNRAIDHCISAIRALMTLAN